MNDWVVLVVIYAAVFASGLLIAILHELGHAFAYLLLTKPDQIDIYIGSYTRAKNAIHFKTGKLRFYIKRSFPFVKGIGLCRSYKMETDYKKDIIILLAGPVFTLVSAAIPAIIAFNTDVNLLVKISCYIFLTFSALSLLANLVPREIQKTGGFGLDNDGKQILFALRLKNAMPAYVEGLQHLWKKEYDAAISKFKNVLEQSPRAAEKVLRLMVTTALEARQYTLAASYLDELEGKFEFTTDDLLNRGIIQSVTDQHDAAISTYSLVLKKDTRNLLALNNIGSELIEKGAHEVAKRALDRAIKLKPDFDAPYSNLGYSQILQGNLDEGKLLIDQCLQLNPKNADAYKTLGIYYLKRKEPALARSNFDKAVEIDADIDLGAYIEETQSVTDQGIPGA
jgi:tetratricopeptide (TPR) repeat protein